MLLLQPFAWNISIFRNDFEKGRKLLPYSIRLCSKRFVSLILFQFNLFVCDFQLITQGNWFRTNFRLPSFFPYIALASLAPSLALSPTLFGRIRWHCDNVALALSLTLRGKKKVYWKMVQSIIRHKPKNISKHNLNISSNSNQISRIGFEMYTYMCRGKREPFLAGTQTLVCMEPLFNEKIRKTVNRTVSVQRCFQYIVNAGSENAFKSPMIRSFAQQMFYVYILNEYTA